MRKARQIYAQRRDAFGELLSRSFGEAIGFRIPAGGLAFWTTFRDEATLDALERNAAAHGLRFLPSRCFAAPPQCGRGLRLGFGSLDADEAERVIARLRRAALAEPSLSC